MGRRKRASFAAWARRVERVIVRRYRTRLRAVDNEVTQDDLREGFDKGLLPHEFVNLYVSELENANEHDDDDESGSADWDEQEWAQAKMD